MNNLASIVFYLSMAIVLYVYVGYPVLLWIWSRIARRAVKKTKYAPTVSIIVAAHNERALIESRILSLRTLDYASQDVEIILSLDGPTDGTELVARKYETDRVHVLVSKSREGKAAALNRGAAKATGEILVFVDVRQVLDPSAVRELAANFEDASVGAVTGELLLMDRFGKEAGDAVGLYWRYEKQLRSMESDIHSTLGATGALYAMRRSLYRSIRRHTILDDVAIPMTAVLDGKRIVFDRTARAYDRVGSSSASEFTRKVRTLTGNFQLVTQMPELILPWRNPVLIQFVSHKIGRLFVPYFLIALFASNLFLKGNAYQGVLILQCAWYLLACTGALLSMRPPCGRSTMRRVVLFPYVVVLMNWAAVVGLLHFVSGKPNVWSGNETAEFSTNDVQPHDSTDRFDSELPEVV